MAKILTFPHPVLRQKAQPVPQITAAIRQLANDLLETVIPDPREPLGVGLAANQIGQLWRVFVMLMPDKKIEVIINPRILKTSKIMFLQVPKKDQFFEGCLSFPGFYGFVNRPAKIKVAYQTLTGRQKTIRLALPYSVYFQHELDHLDGKLFIDYINQSGEQLYFGTGRGHLKPVKNPFKV